VNIAKKATVFLGGGRITRALIAGLRLSGYDRRVVVYDHNPGKLHALRREFGVETPRDLASAVARAETLIVAVRPESVAELLDEIAKLGTIVQARIAVSLAAGIPLKKLRQRLGGSVRWARAMPSPVCRIGRGLTAVTFARDFPPADRKRLCKFFQLVGAVLEMPESHFDAFSAAYSPSHGYHALAVLANAAERTGLDRKTALTAGAHALSEAILYWKQSGQTLAELLHESATPGGTSAATMAAMKAAGYERAILQGLKAGIRQARMNAQRI
jgi:pyrroline-5-carboxylate reductase